MVQNKVKSANPDHKDQKSSNGMDKLKWLLVAIVVGVSVYANVYFAQVSVAIRASLLIIVGVVTLWFASTTTQGAKAWQFVKEARVEMRKVVWPTRKETVNTTLVVILVVLLAALLLWIFDSVFLYIVGSIIVI